MAFLKPETYVGTWIEVRHTAGSGSWIPYDVLGGDPDSYTPEDVLDHTDALDVNDVEEILVHRNAIGVRLSAPGYMDATEWSVHSTVEDAREELANLLDMGEGLDDEGRDVDDVAREEIPDDENRVRVEFVRKREGEEWERVPVAVFPELEEDPRRHVVTYVRVGQHGSGDLAYLRGEDFESTDDGDDETRKLADELERIGYTFARVRTVYVEGDEPEDGDGPDGGTAPPDAPPDGETCPECGRGLGDDYTDECDACEGDLSERLSDLVREVEERAGRLRPGTCATFTSSRRHRTRRGSRVSVVRRLEESEDDETGPTFHVVFEDGFATDAFLDELEPEPDAPDVSPFGAPGMSEDARLPAFARRALELAVMAEEERAEAQERGENPSYGWSDKVALAAYRWGLLPRTRTASEDADCFRGRVGFYMESQARETAGRVG